MYDRDAVVDNVVLGFYSGTGGQAGAMSTLWDKVPPGSFPVSAVLPPAGGTAGLGRLASLLSGEVWSVMGVHNSIEVGICGEGFPDQVASDGRQLRTVAGKVV